MKRQGKFLVMDADGLFNFARSSEMIAK